MPGARSLALFWATLILVCLPRADAQVAPGITVGAPKAFDNRTLNLMLERLSAQLAGINVVDQKSLAQAIGTVQGSSVQDTESSLSVQGGLPAPPSQAQNSSSTNSTSKTSATPSASALPDLIATPGAFTSLKYGPSASDLLSEQVDVTYQIINLQMLLDRSLSDRLLNSSFNPRLQTVVGFNVSIDPPRNAENAVAVVEITLTKNTDPCQAGKKCGEPEPCSANTTFVDSPSLVASMPQEHTYNAAALSSKSRAFGGSAVAKLVTVGYTERRRGQTYYMFRDNDTISFEKQSCPGAGKVTFGWAFRPVLGRKSVAPGSRQLFAVVSLPEDDSYSPGVTNPDSKPDPSVTYAVAIKAYWRKYDPGTLTSANNKEISPWAKLGHVLSLGTSLAYAPSGVTSIPNYQLVVPRTSTYLDHLLPEFQSITWHPIGTKQASIAVKGNNLFYDTHIAIGDKLLTGAQDGLRLVSDQGMDIITDISALYGDVSVLGRYGPATPLELEYAAKKDLSVLNADFDTTALGGYINLTLLPTFDNNNCLKPSDLASDQLGQPIVFINGAVIPGPYQFPPVGKPFPDDCISVSARVPEASMPKLGGIAMLKFPFRKGISASQRLYNPTTVYHLQTLTADKDFLLTKDDYAFVPSSSKSPVPITAKNWQIIIGADSPLPLSEAPCPAKFPKDSNVFCLLTPNENLARIMIGKNYPCSDTTTPSAHSAAPAAAKGSPANASPKSSSSQKGDSKSKTCLPKSFLLQNAQTKDGTLQWVATYPISVSASGDDTKSDSAKATLDPNQKQSVNQHDLVWCSFKGKSLSSVSAVTIANSKLEINPSKDGTSIAVFLPEWATAWPAQVDLTFLDKQNTQIGTAQVTVKPNPSGATK
jgi:hypothetical protein